MATEAVDIVVSVIDKASNELSSITQKLGGFNVIAKTIGTALSAAGTAVTGLSALAVNSASNLNESINAVNVVFGDAAKTIFDFGQTAAQSAGLSQRAFNEAVTPIGAMLLNMGLGADEAANASVNLAQRAADMASVFNTELSDAIVAIQAGLRGEADPLERFGVGLNETSVKAYALQQGLIAAGGEMDANTKITARLGLLFQQTDRIAGDFQNTSDGLANSMRILKAQIQDLAGQAGQALIPMVEKAVAALKPIVEAIAAWVDENPKLAAAIVAVIAVMGALMLVLGPILFALGSLATVGAAVGISLLPLIAIIAGISLVIASLVAAAVLIIANWESIKEKAAEIWNIIKTTVINKVNELAAVVTNSFNILKDSLNNTLTNIANFFSSIWSSINTIINTAVALIVGLVISAFDTLGIDIILIWQLIKQSISDAWNLISLGITEALNLINTIWTVIWGGIQTLTFAIWDAIVGKIQEKTTSASNTINNFINGVSKLWNDFWGSASGIVSELWDSVESIVVSSINSVLSKINAAIAAVNKVVAKGAGALGITAATLPSIPLLAKGGNIVGSGAAIVGEAGPELINLPRGAKVTPLTNNGLGITININNPQVWSDDDIVEKIGNPLIQVLKQHAAIV